jgi:hypothetical protein
MPSRFKNLDRYPKSTLPVVHGSTIFQGKRGSVDCEAAAVYNAIIA